MKVFRFGLVLLLIAFVIVIPASAVWVNTSTILISSYVKNQTTTSTWGDLKDTDLGTAAGTGPFTRLHCDGSSNSMISRAVFVYDTESLTGYNVTSAYIKLRNSVAYGADDVVVLGYTGNISPTIYDYNKFDWDGDYVVVPNTSVGAWTDYQIPTSLVSPGGLSRIGVVSLWDFYDNFTGDAGYSIYEPVTLCVNVEPITGNFQVGAADSAGDGLAGATVTLWYDGALQDTGVTTDYFPYDVFFTVPNYTYVNGTVTLAGYQDGSYTYYKNYWDGWVTVTLYRTGEEIPNETSGMGNLILTFRDEVTDEIIDNVELNIYTDIDREDLFQNLYTLDGHLTTTIWKDNMYHFTAYAGGYWDSPFSYEISTTPEYYTVYLTPKTYTTFEPEIRIWVYSTSSQPIYNAYVSVSSSSDSGGGYTSGDGHYTYSDCSPIPTGQSRVYTLIASKGGYSSYTATTTVSTLSPTVTFYLTPTVNATPTPTMTTNYTPVVTPVWSGTNGTPGNYKEQFLNFTMYQFGVDAWSAGILVGLVITILCAVFVGGCLAGYGSGNGAGVGAMIGGAFGWVAATMLGFIPLWALIVTIALVAMVFFLFRGGGSEG